MMNEDIKKQYIDETYENEKTRKTVWSTFKVTEEFEKKNNKDLVDFNRDEIRDMLSSQEFGNYRTAIVRLSYIRNYVRYSELMDNKKEQSDLWDMPPEELKKICEEKIKDSLSEVITRQDILDLMGELKNPRDRAILLGLFEGIQGKKYSEFIAIRPEDVKEDEIYLRNRDQMLKVSSDLIHAFKDAMTARVSVNLSEKRKQIFYLTEGEHVALKVYSSSKDPEGAFIKVVPNIAKRFKKSYLTPSNIRAWGMADMLYHYAKEMGVSADVAYAMYKGDIAEQFGVKIANPDVVISRCEKLIELDRDKEKSQ